MLIKHDGQPHGYPEMAAALRELADMAERGEIISIGWAAEKRAGGITFRAMHDIGSTAHGLMGGLFACMQSIVNRYLL